MKKTRKKRIGPAVDFTSFPMRLSIKKRAVVFDSPSIFFGYGRSHQRFSWVTNAR